MNHGRFAIGLATLALCLPAAAQQATVTELEQRLAADPTSFPAKVALAEAYLQQCELEKSLAMWRSVLTVAPDHPRAKFAVARLSLQLVDLDAHLDVLEKLIDKGLIGDMEGLLDTAGKRAAGDAQKARLLYLRGQLAAAGKDWDTAARTHYETAMRAYRGSVWAGRAALGLAKLEVRRVRKAEATRLLRQLAADKEMTDAAVKEEAQYHLVQIAAADQTPAQAVAALRDLLAATRTAKVRRLILWQIASQAPSAEGEGPAAAIQASAAILAGDPPYEEGQAVLAKLMETAQTSQDKPALDSLLAELEKTAPKDPALAREASFVRAEAFLSRAVVEYDTARMRGLVAEAGKLHTALQADQKTYQDAGRLDALAGRALLVEAQKLIALGATVEGLEVLTRARERDLARLPADPKASLDRLNRIAALLEHVGEWEMAIDLYREVASRFGHLPQGRDALWKVATLQNFKLDAPMAALDVCAEYASRYPSELPYRQLTIGERMRRLGYANVLDFQKRTGLKLDGLAGPLTRRKIEELEASFDLIAVRDGDEGVLRGAFVHPMIFSIARRLEQAGRADEAIQAYRTFLCLFPTKAGADDALIAIARIFRDHLLFAEALGAYTELMEDFPKGDATSEAYIEAAGCLENLGRWKEAGELYELYVKKFPKYKHVELCKSRRAMLEDILQYEDFIASNAANPKLPEARYQIGVILYQKLKNLTKAAVQFAEVARLHPKHVRAADGLYTCGTAQLRVENFPAARKAFGELAAGYPDSRLADDAQFWIGHTYEYSARALGRLDEKHIVIRRRSLQARARLLGDVPLRRQYHPAAQEGPELNEDDWGGGDVLGLGVLTSGSKRDRVNADLFRAIAAYRQVVEKFKMGDKAGEALLRIGTIYTQYLNDPEKGLEAYKELLAHYPGSKEAVGALYEVGVYHMTKKKAYDEAILAFQQFIYNYPNDPMVEEAVLAIARCHAEKKDWDKALDAYQSYLNKFPSGKFADFAKARIEWIRMYHF